MTRPTVACTQPQWNRSNYEGSEVTILNEAIIATFRAGLRGGLIEPGEPTYDAARKVYNGMIIDRRPRLIARCVDVADVMTAVKFGHEQKLLVAIRGGGHNAGGLGVCDEGLVIDLHNLVFNSQHPSTDFADFLASPNPLHK